MTDCNYSKVGDSFICSQCGHSTKIKGLKRNCGSPTQEKIKHSTTTVKSNFGDLIHSQLSWIGIKEKEECDCQDLVRQLNMLGPKWGSENMDMLLDVFEERAKKYDYPFNRLGARGLINLAILRAKTL